MKNMEIGIISKETIKPSSPILEPFKLSLLDQIIPPTYSPLILFYPKNGAHSGSTQLSARLKHSLSDTLTHFYPFSGRTQNNFIIHDYNEGVPYIETRVNTNLLNFLQYPHMEKLHQFLPCQPACYQLHPDTMPQLAAQLNIFECGGIALGLCFSHKIIDGATMITFLKSWSAIARQSYDKSCLHPNLSEASRQFIPKELLSHTTNLLGSEGKNVVGRFVFNVKAVEALRTKARSEKVENPTRTEALSAFIWKHALANSKSLSLATQVVNIRRRTRPRLPDNSIGNLLWWAVSSCNSGEAQMELQSLVNKMREAVDKVNSDYLSTLQGDKGFLGVYELQKQLMELKTKEKPKSYVFSSWLKFGVNEIDFGWGKPIWVGLHGGVGHGLLNATILKESGRNNEIEAWMTLNEEDLEKLKNDPEFLSFASFNPNIAIL